MTIIARPIAPPRSGSFRGGKYDLIPGAPKGEAAHAGVTTTVHNELMAKSRKTLPVIDTDTEFFGATEIPTAASAANDQLNKFDIKQLNSSAGSYERIRQIRKELRCSDLWIAIGIYSALAVAAFFVV